MKIEIGLFEVIVTLFYSALVLVLFALGYSLLSWELWLAGFVTVVVVFFAARLWG